MPPPPHQAKGVLAGLDALHDRGVLVDAAAVASAALAVADARDALAAARACHHDHPQHPNAPVVDEIDAALLLEHTRHPPT